VVTGAAIDKHLWVIFRNLIYKSIKGN